MGPAHQFSVDGRPPVGRPANAEEDEERKPLPKVPKPKEKKEKTPASVAKSKVKECQSKITEIKGLQHKVGNSTKLPVGSKEIKLAVS